MSQEVYSVTEATITYLMSSTTYSIQLAAVNSAGTGPYSDTVFATPDSECTSTELLEREHIINFVLNCNLALSFVVVVYVFWGFFLRVCRCVSESK